MDILEAVKCRHSVRSYKDEPISTEIISEINAEIEKCNRESGLNIQFITNEPEAFSGFMAHYGKFGGVRNYIAMIGKKDSELDEKIGYYGEKIVLKAQQLGLNSCWVAMTFSKKKSKYNIQKGEKLVCVISVGIGKTQGSVHNNKPIENLYKANVPVPNWFLNGVKCAALAPTAMNQQKFIFSYDGNSVDAKANGGFYSKIDLGIVKYHFEIGAGKNNFKWK